MKVLAFLMAWTALMTVWAAAGSTELMVSVAFISGVSVGAGYLVGSSVENWRRRKESENDYDDYY